MFKKLLLTFAALILLLVLAVGWLLATQSGLNTAISLAQKNFASTGDRGREGTSDRLCHLVTGALSTRTGQWCRD